MLLRKDRPLLVPVILALSAIVTILLLYRFGNFREERAVRLFLEELKAGAYPEAYQRWGPSPTYNYADFLSDWGGDRGYYGKVTNFKILESKTKGTGVVVYVQFDHLKKPVAFWVDRKTHHLGFAPF
jgi:hypothetical protein